MTTPDTPKPAQPAGETPKPAAPPLAPAAPAVSSKPAPAPAAVAPKPVAAAKPAGPPASPARRKFISWFGLAWTAFTAATMGALSLVLRFMFPNVLFEPPTTFKAGFPSDYEVGTVDMRWKDKFGTFIIRTAEGLYALSNVCTHLGCTVNWLGGENKFKCPCHGSGYYKNGINFEGPTPRPLERFAISLAEDGQIVIDKSRKYQQEKGQWNDPNSFLNV